MSNSNNQDSLIELILAQQELIKAQQEIFGGLDEKGDEQFQQVLSYGSQIAELYEKRIHEIKNLKNENRVLQEECKIQEQRYNSLYAMVCQKIDALQETFTPDEIKVLRLEASSNYYSSWNSIEEQSRTMLGTALFLFQQSKGTNNDFSPVVVEYCRVFENEMKRKIFLKFLEAIKDEQLLGRDDSFAALGKAAQDSRPEKPTVTLKVMALCLKYMNHSLRQDSIANALACYLDNNNWNRKRVTETAFTSDSVEYADNYRNKAAHPERLMNEKEAEQCTQITERLVSHLLSCMPKKEAP